MEDQSPFVTSSSFGSDAPEDEHRGSEEAKPRVQPWDDMDDVLDLTGGAGHFSHPPFSVSFPGKAEEEEEERKSYSDSLEPSPEDEEPSSIGSDLPRAPVIPSAPEEEHDRTAAPYGAPSKPGSVGYAFIAQYLRGEDVNLFPIPASSAPLMHSSSDFVMDLQQPSSTVPAGHQELSSLLLESAASLHSLSPLSADSSKEQLVAFPADSTTPEAFKDPIRDDHMESRTIDDSPIVEKLGSGLPSSFHKSTSAVKDDSEDLFFSERGHAIEHPTSFTESASKIYTQSAKEMFSGMLKSVGPPHEEFSEGLDEQYVDFKPFGSTGGHGVQFEPKDFSVDLKSNISTLSFEPAVKLEDKYNEEKDVDVSDDISPASPEATSDYEIFAPLQQTNPFAFGAHQMSDNVTDEKKMEELKSHVTSSRVGSNVATVNPFLVDQEGDYVATDAVHGSVASKAEGLTPDIVQEAYESEVYDLGGPKLGYEPKIDLVPTATKASQESVSPSVQNVALFEDSDSVSSPVLPDIVMEAPVTSAPIGLDAVAPQPDVSPVGRMTPVCEEKLKFESEKPPSYEEATNKQSAKEEEERVVVETVKEAPVEEPEASYISIACDLVKETIPEQVVTDFSKALKSEFDSQFSSHFEDSSPESEQSEPSYKLWEAEVIHKEAATTVLGTERSVTPEKEPLSDAKWKEPSLGKSYLESSQPEAYVSKFVAEEPVVQISKPDKLLQMEEFGKAEYSKDFEIPTTIAPKKEISAPSKVEQVDIKAPKWFEDQVPKEQPKVKEDVFVKDKAKESSDKVVDLSKPGSEAVVHEEASKPMPPAKETSFPTPASKEKKESSPASAPQAPCCFSNSVVDLLYWRDIKKSGSVFGASLFLLLSLTVFSIVSVAAYIALGLLSVSISFRIYKGVLQAIQKSDEGHPFRAYLDSSVTVSEDLVQKYCNIALSHVNCTIKELRRLFLVEDLVDSLKFAVLMWVFTYIGALFNGLTLLILALISLFSIPVIYERHQTQIDHYLSLINKNVKNTTDLILSKVPGLKRKAD